MVPELEYDLQDTVDWVGIGLLIPMLENTQLVSFDWSNNNGAVDVKMDGSDFEEKLSCKMLGLTFSSKLDWDSYIISNAKIAFKKIGALIHSMKFISPEVALYLCKSTINVNLGSNAWNTVVMSGLVLLIVANWNC